MWKSRLLIVWFILLLAGCKGNELTTPTPFPPTPERISWGVGSSITPVPALLPDVVANPEFYEGAYLQVTGQYFRKPLLVCGVDPHPSPAGWDLVVGDTRVPAGGFDKELRQLMPDGITVTVIGRFTQWQGPVGCGKQARPTEMWYLDVVKMVDPAQLALVTLTPASSDGSVFDGSVSEELFTPVANPDEPLLGDDSFLGTLPPVAPPTNTPRSTQAVPVETLGAGFTPVATNDIGIFTPTASGTETAVISGTVQSTPGTSTVTNTPPPGASLTPTPNGANSTPIATAVSGSAVRIMSGELEIAGFKMTDLEPAKIHEWTMPLNAGDKVEVTVIGEPAMDMIIKIYDKNLTELVNRDATSTGQMESVTFTPSTTGDFKVRISEKRGKAGGYLLALGAEDFLLLYPQGMLTYGEGKSASISWDELHYWFFKGTQNDVIDLAISCNINADLAVILYDSAGNDIAEQFFQGDMQDISLPKTDWYVFEIEFWDQSSNSCTYNLVVTN
ncbi:MAG: hypothetical protein IAF02_10220 [Anaerolineae bacterium]|nr:hypothetical protein [Anaerolineae bacterium]